MECAFFNLADYGRFGDAVSLELIGALNIMDGKLSRSVITEIIGIRRAIVPVPKIFWQQKFFWKAWKADDYYSGMWQVFLSP